ncbi:MAG: hypothetical protein C0184_00805 [Chloroflexus aggregans]|uniref:Uncharacterized protein n=1 Tax=Chloroflexus aggregans TaxID=152260 RepID=A0A2J6XFG0_9CHLR|nr:MAG: hypothetical protein C0184_00805 [Chloroflexus aggregans]
MYHIRQRFARFAFYCRLAFHSLTPVRRLVDLIIAQTLFALPMPLRRLLFRGQSAFCPICNSRLSGFITLHRPYHHWCPVCRSLQRAASVDLALS